MLRIDLVFRRKIVRSCKFTLNFNLTELNESFFDFNEIWGRGRLTDTQILQCPQLLNSTGLNGLKRAHLGFTGVKKGSLDSMGSIKILVICHTFFVVILAQGLDLLGLNSHQN